MKTPKKLSWFDEQFKDPEFVREFLKESRLVERMMIAEAIASTKRRERRRAVRMLGVLVNMTACSCHASKRSHVEDMILGREKRRAK